MILINIWEGVDAATEARRFAGVWGLEGTILLDETGEYAGRLGIRGVPSNVVVDPTGLVRAVGVATPGELHEAVDRLLAGGLPEVQPLRAPGAVMPERTCRSGRAGAGGPERSAEAGGEAPAGSRRDRPGHAGEPLFRAVGR